MEVYKTQKMLINGAFVRSESNRTLPLYFADKTTVSGRYCVGSKKDFRNSVEAAISGLSLWQSKDAYNRGQIIYRLGEMAAARSLEFREILEKELGISKNKANEQIEKMLETIIFYAGFADKAQSFLSMLNPVMGSFVHHSNIEGMGVCALIESDELDLEGFVGRICANLVACNSLVVLVGAKTNCLLSLFAEIIASSDIPPGVINLISGNLSELSEQIAGHYSLRLICWASTDNASKIQKLASHNLKRFVKTREYSDPVQFLLSLVEVKSLWQPTGF